MCIQYIYFSVCVFNIRYIHSQYTIYIYLYIYREREKERLVYIYISFYSVKALFLLHKFLISFYTSVYVYFCLFFKYFKIINYLHNFPLSFLSSTSSHASSSSLKFWLLFSLFLP